MKLETGLERLKECYMFAHLTYCILTVTCLVGWLRTTQMQLNDGYNLAWALCMLAILALIPAQHRIITKTFYRDHRGLHLYKALYTITICAVYLTIITGVFTEKELTLLKIVPVILNSIVCGTAYGLATSVIVSLVAAAVDWYSLESNSGWLTEHILHFSLLITTAWFIGQSFQYIKNLFYQLAESENNHKSILDNLGVATLHVDRNNRVASWNRAFSELAGPDIVEGADFGNMVSKHLPFLKTNIQELTSCKGLREPILGRAVDSRGQLIPVQCIAYPASPGLEENNGIILCINDISLREKLEEVNACNNYFIDFIDAGVILTDVSGEIIEMNSRAEIFLGISKQNMRNSTLPHFFQRTEPTYSTTPGNSSQELSLDGKTLLVHSMELRSARGKTIGNISIFTDITDQKDMETKIHRSATLSAIGELAAGMAHEIRNPLTSIRGFLQIMREKETARVSELISYFDIILGEVDRINIIVTEFLKLAKPEKIVLNTVCINQIIDSIWDLLYSEALLRECHLIKELDQNCPNIMGNVDMLKQVIINLVSNAWQATGKGGTVRVSTSRAGGKVLLSVSDDGVGIDQEVLPRIFDPFYTTKDEGTGLGLAITSKIINDHNAIIKVNSRPGSGTTFYITFSAINKADANADTAATA